MSRIPIGAGVRSNITGKLGRAFRNADGNIRGHIFVQWDGDRDRQTVSIHHVTLVADSYEAAKSWDAAKAAAPMSGAVCQPVAGTCCTYRVVVCDDLVLGFIRLDVGGKQWIARTTGSETAAACLRRFPEKADAVAWLQEREPARGSGKRRAA
jgi:hypothetical protein